MLSKNSVKLVNYMANTYDFNITQGCSFLAYLNCQNSDGSYINLSGFSARGLVKNQYADTGYLYNLNPQPIEPMVSGIIMVSGSSSSTSGFLAGEFSYDIEIYNGNCALKVLYGDFSVNPSTSYVN